MKSNYVEQSLTMAFRALSTITKDDLQDLSVVECARMLYTLPPVPELAVVRRRLAYRLQRQLSASWVEQGHAYEVFSVLIALWKYQPASVTGEHLARVLRRLIDAELAVGGPYYFNNVDVIATNAQIAIFMRLVAKPLPNVDAFLTQIVNSSQFGDTDLHRAALIYVLAQATATPKLASYVSGHLTDRLWQAPLGIAIVLSVFRGVAHTKSIHRAMTVLCSQQHNGWWEDTAVATSTQQNTKLVTTAIVIGALVTHQPRTETTVSAFRKRQQLIASAACQTFITYKEPLRSLAVQSVAKVIAADKNFEITQLSLLFAEALKVPDTLTEQQHTKLGLASLFGWIAYTIYDDFLDGEGQPAKLPVANIAMRASVDYFRAALPAHKEFVRHVSKAFCKMDEANAWEVRHCRFGMCNQAIVIGELPKYGRRTILAARSFAHALAPMAVLWHSGQTSKTASQHHMKAAFTHYLIARQLSDDLHDWSDDIKTGQVSFVVAAILRDMHAMPGVYELTTLLPTMQKSFRRTVLPKVCRYILRHVAIARQEFQKSELLQTDNNLYKLLDKLELTAVHALDRHAKSLAFYRASKTMRFK